jgi:glc operon protein GlcG
MTLSLAEANSIMDSAIAKARQLEVIVSVAVCNEQGRLLALNRMDGAFADANQFFIGKAVVSALTGLPSGKVDSTAVIPPSGTVVGEGVPMVRIRGGLPIFRCGQIEGACGVGGAPSREQDEECARAGIAAILR